MSGVLLGVMVIFFGAGFGCGYWKRAMEDCKNCGWWYGQLDDSWRDKKKK